MRLVQCAFDGRHPLRRPPRDHFCTRGQLKLERDENLALQAFKRAVGARLLQHFGGEVSACLAPPLLTMNRSCRYATRVYKQLGLRPVGQEVGPRPRRH